MYVIKADGRREKFNPNKIIRTCLRADANRKTAEEIVNIVRKRIRDDTTTHQIYGVVLAELRKRRDRSSFIFTLREGIARLDSVSFELFVKKLLEAYNYKCKWDAILRGRCIDHQIDVIAQRDRVFLVECKHHMNYHRFCGLGDTLQVQARLDDVQDGFLDGKNRYDFDGAWIITNTKFSEHAKQYARAKGMRLSGWRFKDAESLENLVNSKKVFPVTILRSTMGTKRYLLEKGIVTLNDLLAADPKRLKQMDRFKLESLKRQAVKLVS